MIALAFALLFLFVIFAIFWWATAPMRDLFNDNNDDENATR